jgi:hypothetical protein
MAAVEPPCQPGFLSPADSPDAMASQEAVVDNALDKEHGNILFVFP